MLNGYSPFKQSGFGALAHSITTRNIQPMKQNLSSEVRDLIDKLLRIDPKERLTMDEIFEHPWMKNLAKSFNNLNIQKSRLFSIKDKGYKSDRSHNAKNDKADENVYKKLLNDNFDKKSTSSRNNQNFITNSEPSSKIRHQRSKTSYNQDFDEITLDNLMRQSGMQSDLNFFTNITKAFKTSEKQSKNKEDDYELKSIIIDPSTGLKTYTRVKKNRQNSDISKKERSKEKYLKNSLTTPNLTFGEKPEAMKDVDRMQKIAEEGNRRQINHGRKNLDTADPSVGKDNKSSPEISPDDERKALPKHNFQNNNYIADNNKNDQEIDRIVSFGPELKSHIQSNHDNANKTKKETKNQFKETNEEEIPYLHKVVKNKKKTLTNSSGTGSIIKSNRGSSVEESYKKDPSPKRSKKFSTRRSIKRDKNKKNKRQTYNDFLTKEEKYADKHRDRHETYNAWKNRSDNIFKSHTNHLRKNRRRNGEDHQKLFNDDVSNPRYSSNVQSEYSEYSEYLTDPDKVQEEIARRKEKVNRLLKGMDEIGMGGYSSRRKHINGRGRNRDSLRSRRKKKMNLIDKQQTVIILFLKI